MTSAEIILWNDIEAFSLDDLQSGFKFSTRLARENGWTDTYSLRVIEEYKKFIFLCCISKNSVTPSDPVDQAWHLHLTYTKSYWVDFCKNTLKKEIHHNPTKGGIIEANKFDTFYTASQSLYKEKFEHEPPEDIWHNNQKRFSDIDFQRVNIGKYWLIRKPNASFKNNIIKFILLFVALSFISADDENAFLVFFAVIIGLGLLVSIINAFRGKGNNNGDSNYHSTDSSTDGGHHHHDGNSGCSSGCSGCSASGCSGCGGGGD